MKAVRKVGDNKKLETKMDYKNVNLSVFYSVITTFVVINNKLHMLIHKIKAQSMSILCRQRKLSCLVSIGTASVAYSIVLGVIEGACMLITIIPHLLKHLTLFHHKFLWSDVST